MRTIALVKRICQQMFRDKRTLGLMMFAPLVILTLIHFLFTSDAANATIGVSNVNPSLVEQLKNNDIIVKQYGNRVNSKDTIIEDHLDGFLEVKNDGQFKLTLKNTDQTLSKALQIKIQKAIAGETAKKQSANLAQFIQTVQSHIQGPSLKIDAVETPKMSTAYLYGSKDTTFFDLLGPILVGFFVFFFVFLISGIALLRERTTGTLDRLMATPIRRKDIVFGYLAGYGLFAVIQTIIVVFYAVNVLDIVLVGSLWNVIIINLMLALVALSLGILLSAFAHSEFQMMQFIPIVVVPQVFFAGILPVEGMENWLQLIAKIMPLYYGGDALQAVMYKGLGFEDIRYDLLVLLGFSLFFIALNIIALKKYRNI